ncbi:pyridoxamine 5'-phosphate oxidase family protein [Fulvivirga sedimenti]|uniref:Pyridoxamine 5'-phosphate oxidase family protein n=1 Tax=Fulvivirga sedimenti TaxID=2879465 RepID=A0A9X1HT64_9BACT|nr:pyridoxamine 5'-phosphate oxidase family protein [Fulvivirga sedimenti]MCA6075554.1 pyridoxamine 5'-phosphate oxidase family protein [Fulvivirga sedimenti]MCA6076731.1 pyridoxamine 5'-phosphate oxidase family protein [Fulvivirga sedimenti]MCA6077859.1 pyridoxamine 5'-phosphate oxidase family protein [Fulvivirga sedimenti]
MSNSYPINSRNKVKRVPNRGHYDQKTVFEVLDAGEIAHVSFVADGQPFVIPTLYGRSGEVIYIHGSAASRMLKALEVGIPCSVCVTLVDGLVLARSAFHHSMNYRSVVLFGTARKVEGDEKNEALRTISEHLIPGRWNEVREPTDKELKGTMVLRLEIDQASAKIRTGGPKDDTEDYDLPIWAGTVPFKRQVLTPETDPDSKASYDVPESVLNYLKSKE